MPHDHQLDGGAMPIAIDRMRLIRLGEEQCCELIEWINGLGHRRSYGLGTTNTLLSSPLSLTCW